MGIFDKAKKAVTDNAEKAKQAVNDNQDKIDGALDKVGDAVDRKTGGKHHDKIVKAKKAVQDKTGNL